MQETIMESLVIDYPVEGETVASPEYTIRLSATGGHAGGVRRAEVSIDGGPWSACRPAAGYWWYDWSGYLAGRHQLRTRLQLRDGRVAQAAQRTIAVNLASAAAAPSSNGAAQELERRGRGLLWLSLSVVSAGLVWAAAAYARRRRSARST
jgi:hypothetical protein